MLEVVAVLVAAGLAWAFIHWLFPDDRVLISRDFDDAMVAVTRRFL